MDQLLRRRLGGEIFQDLAVQSSRAQAQYYEAHLRAGQRHGRVGVNQRPMNTYVLRPSQITAQAAVDGLCVSRRPLLADRYISAHQMPIGPVGNPMAYRPPTNGPDRPNIHIATKVTGRAS